MAEPIRMCAACRERAAKHELIRIVRTPDGNIVADARDKVSGRGAYICRNPECFKKVRKSRALDRMLNTSVPEEVYEALASIVDGENE